MDVARNYQLFEKEKRRVSYFFTNFPENFMAKHMLKAFLNYGDFEEVVILAKKDQRGKRFGFARAVGIEDPEKFAVKLDNIIIGSEKILVNLPRFDRNGKDQIGNQIEKEERSNTEKVKGCDGRLKDPVNQNVGRSNVSYDEIVKNQSGAANPKTPLPQNQKPVSPPTLNQTSVHQNHSKTIQNHPKTNLNQKQYFQKKRNGYVPPPRPKQPWAHRTYEVEVEHVQKFDRAYVGVVKRPGLSYRMHEEFA